MTKKTKSISELLEALTIDDFIVRTREEVSDADKTAFVNVYLKYPWSRVEELVKKAKETGIDMYRELEKEYENEWEYCFAVVGPKADLLEFFKRELNWDIPEEDLFIPANID